MDEGLSVRLERRGEGAMSKYEGGEVRYEEGEVREVG